MVLYRLCESDAFNERKLAVTWTHVVCLLRSELEAVAVVGLEAGVKQGFLSAQWPSLLY